MLSTYFCLSSIASLSLLLALSSSIPSSWITAGTIGKLSLWSIAFTSYRAFAYFTVDRYDCDRRKSTDAYPAKDRPIRDFSLPDLTGLTRYAPPSTSLIISATIIIGEKIRTGFYENDENYFHEQRWRGISSFDRVTPIRVKLLILNPTKINFYS